MALQVLRALEEEGTRKRSKEVLLKAPIGIVNYLINDKREHIALIEARYGMSVRIEADPMLVSPDYSIEKFKTALRVVPETPVISGHAGLMGAAVDEDEDEDLVDDLIEEEEAEGVEAAEPVARAAAAEGDNGAPGKKKRRRRRRRRGGARDGEAVANGAAGEDEGDEDGEGEGDGDEAVVTAEPVAEGEDKAGPRKRTRKPRARKGEAARVVEAAPEGVVETVAEAESAPAEAAAVEAAPAKPAARKRAPRGKAAVTEAAPEPVAEAVAEPVAEAPAAEAVPAKPARSRAPRAKAAEKAPAKAVPEPVAEAVAEPAPALAPDPGMAATVETVVADPAEGAAVADDPAKPKRKGWWSLGR